jgi:hypothetical protein
LYKLIALDSKPAYSQYSTNIGSSRSNCNNIIADMPSSCTTATTDQDTDCLLLELFELYKIVNTYLEEKRVPNNIQAALDTVVEIV